MLTGDATNADPVCDLSPHHHLITEQVESGLFVRMAILYELLAGKGSDDSEPVSEPPRIGQPA
jgi:hypothetical protein